MPVNTVFLVFGGFPGKQRFRITFVFTFPLTVGKFSIYHRVGGIALPILDGLDKWDVIIGQVVILHIIIIRGRLSFSLSSGDLEIIRHINHGNQKARLGRMD